PVMVCQDGFITSHGVENVETLDNATVKMFIKEHDPYYPLLDTDNPISSGPLDLFDYYFEHKRQQSEAMMHARKVFKQIFKEFGKITGKTYGFYEGYQLEDAEYVVLVMASTADTAKHVVDVLRERGEKVGLFKLNVFRPFPVEEVLKELEGRKAVAVMDRSESFGAMGAALFNEVRSALFESEKKPKIINYVYGLGGRDCDDESLMTVFAELKELEHQDHYEKVRYLGVRD
ncbi:MAG: pyruvate ferredoxin oxidoreductase, partial [Nanoarchaeota archaeon]